MTQETSFPVDILLPDRWWKPVRYRLHEIMRVVGEEVPRHFITDGATIPRIFWFFFPPVCRYFPAAVVHDYLLKSGVGWRVANRKFREALLSSGVSKWRRKTMSVAVGVYGFYRETFRGD